MRSNSRLDFNGSDNVRITKYDQNSVLRYVKLRRVNCKFQLVAIAIPFQLFPALQGCQTDMRTQVYRLKHSLKVTALCHAHSVSLRS